MRVHQLRRLRQSPTTRDWISQTNLEARDFILPYFITEGRKLRQPIKSLPGIDRLSVDNLISDIGGIKGLRAALFFGIPTDKSHNAVSAYQENGVVQQAVRQVKKNFPHLIIITDVCLCGYTTHGHCGILKSPSSKFQVPSSNLQSPRLIDNLKTVKILAKIALSHTQAGADFVAPSAMMDGQVGQIREALDKNGFSDRGILAYSAKYASNFYGPFREAVDSAPQFGDRKSYQMDYRNSDEALREIEQDINEGADIVMVKPALSYLDIIYRAKQRFNLPVAAYNVSGEYAMIKKLAGGDSKKEKELVLEALTSIKRAGADLLITYFAKEAIRWIK